VLAWSLETTIDDLQALADTARGCSVIPRFPALAPLLPSLANRLHERRRFWALADPRVASLSLRLLALHTLCGARRISRWHIPGVNDAFFVVDSPDRRAAESRSTSPGWGGHVEIVEDDALLDHTEQYPATAASVFAGITPLEVSMLTLGSAVEVRRWGGEKCS
jgi:hypothetical protein